MTVTELVERAMRLLEPLTEEQRVNVRTTLLAEVQNALRKLAEAAISSSLLRKTFIVTATNGEASLTPALNADEPLLIDGVKRGQVFVDGFNYAAQWKADRSSLTFPASTQFAYYTLEDQTLIIRGATGLSAYTGPVTIRNAPYMPTLASVPSLLEPLLVEILANYGKSSTMAPENRGRDRRRSEDSGRAAGGV